YYGGDASSRARGVAWKFSRASRRRHAVSILRRRSVGSGRERGPFYKGRRRASGKSRRRTPHRRLDQSDFERQRSGDGALGFGSAIGVQERRISRARKNRGRRRGTFA